MQGIVRGGNNDGGSNIKSIQRGTAIITAGGYTLDISMSSVDINKSIILVSSHASTYIESGKIAGKNLVRAELVSATSITVHTTNITEQNISLSWVVVEFNNVKSKQSGTINSSSSVTISPVDLSKSLSFVTFVVGSTDYTGYMMQHQLVNSTTLQFEWVDGAWAYADWQVIEFN